MAKSYDDFLGEHSLAKVRLYGYYLAIYLNILSRAKIASKILLFDLFAGEGKYAGGEKGSPLIALECIRAHAVNNNGCPDIKITFNDNGKSTIEPGKDKIERVKEFASQIALPTNVEINFSGHNFRDALNYAKQAFKAEANPAGLFFLDPFGYKDVPPQVIRDILQMGHTEVLLFLPTFPMFRLSNSVQANDFPGSEPLRAFLFALFGKETEFKSVHDFIAKTKTQFKSFLGKKIFVDTFTLETQEKNVHCLFFFTSNMQGFRKMVEAKWELDKDMGEGHRANSTQMLFTAYEIRNYPDKVLEFIRTSTRGRTNRELLLFGLENGFLPKHTNQVLHDHSDKIVRAPLDGGPDRGNYLDTKERTMQFTFKKD
ncbi:MAG: three-Cys-motif partner protein TcmP [Anaerolineales bacterium]|nr:three-Cys-motif partner protein TcmP [Anaerolineales bacterium]